jgi:hypothetical protein
MSPVRVSTLAAALRLARPSTDGQLYSVIHLPSAAIMAATGIVAQIGEPFLVVIADVDEVTLITHADAWEAIERRLPDAQASHNWRLITFDAALDHSLVGFLAVIAAALAEASVSIFAISAYQRDHLLVKADQFETAWKILSQADKQ